jgi:universal stress protein A
MKSKAVRRILVGVDFSSSARSALQFACGLGASLGASLDVLYVLESDPAPGAADEAAAKEELRRFIATADCDGALALGTRIESGEARERIVSVADREGYDLIVLGTHGRTGRPRSFAGSVAESVVRTASCPVVTVRET